MLYLLHISLLPSAYFIIKQDTFIVTCSLSSCKYNSIMLQPFVFIAGGINPLIPPCRVSRTGVHYNVLSPQPSNPPSAFAICL